MLNWLFMAWRFDILTSWMIWMEINRMENLLELWLSLYAFTLYMLYDSLDYWCSSLLCRKWNHGNSWGKQAPNLVNIVNQGKYLEDSKASSWKYFSLQLYGCFLVNMFNQNLDAWRTCQGKCNVIFMCHVTLV